MNMFTDDKIHPTEPAETSSHTWHKGKTPVLETKTTAEEALSTIVLTCIDHLRANEGCVLSRAHEEGVHQMRVATRRLRSSLSLFRNLLPTEQRKYINRELRWLIGEMGPARDWDVFVGEVLSPVMNDLPEEKPLKVLHRIAEEQGDKGYETAQAAIRSQRYTGLVMLMSAWAEGRSWHDESTPEASFAIRGVAIDVADDLLEAHYQGVCAIGKDFDALDDERRHNLRIQIKKLRYASEFFRSLYPKQKSATFIDALKTLQDQLGANNDLAVARGLLDGIIKNEKGKTRTRLSYAAGIIVGWHSHVSDHRELTLTETWQRFANTQPFWKNKSDAVAPLPDELTTALGGAIENHGVKAALPQKAARDARIPESSASNRTPPRRRPRKRAVPEIAENRTGAEKRDDTIN